MIETERFIRTGRILVVDDQPDICTVCRVALRKEGYRVETAFDAEQALELLETEAFDLLLTDISLPGIGGLELGRLAQERQPILDVVIMTGSPSYDLLQDALQQGVADYLPKPFNIDQLRLTITRTLQRQQLRRENERLLTLTHVIEAGRAFTTSLDPLTVASALVQAVQRETATGCVHVDLGERGIVPGPGTHLPCGLTDDRERADACVVRLELQAHGKVVGQLVLAATNDQQAVARPSEVVSLLMEHAALALNNAEVYEALIDLDQQKSEFIALASHELRTPLSVVLGYGGMLKGKLDGKQGYYVQEITRAALRINDLVDDLIHLDRMQRDEFLLDSQMCDLHMILETLHGEMLPLAEARGVALQFRGPTEHMEVPADPVWFLYALAHLISNGIRFTPKGGRVVVSAGVSSSNGDAVLFVVDDTGIGIAPKEVHRIFRRFYQVADSRTREEGGLGIGLALARGIIGMHGGDLMVKSITGRGSRFVVSLPLNAPPA
ncbi:MAG: hypothetical protein NVSMB42_06590 [Herpetosiphon sp.]